MLYIRDEWAGHMSIGKGADYKYKETLFQFCAEEVCGRILAIIYSYKKNCFSFVLNSVDWDLLCWSSKEWKLTNMA